MLISTAYKPSDLKCRPNHGVQCNDQQLHAEGDTLDFVLLARLMWFLVRGECPEGHRRGGDVVGTYALSGVRLNEK